MNQRLVILCSVSGAGKTTAMQAFEDLGYYAVDNMPPLMWTELVKVANEDGIGPVLLAVDARSGRYLRDATAGLDALQAAGHAPFLLFLTADDEVLIRRFNLTRRSHPLREGSLLSDLGSERGSLRSLHDRADLVLDTGNYNETQLRQAIGRHFSTGEDFHLRLVSFGFKRGVPLDADMVLDVRHMTNPYYSNELRPLPGTDERVAATVFDAAGDLTYSRLRRFVRDAVRQAAASRRQGYTVAIGCTGGQHRSVAVVERLVGDLGSEFRTNSSHRDLEDALKEHAQ